VLLADREGEHEMKPLRPRPDVPADVLASCLPLAVRAHVLAGGGTSEHRPVSIAFLRFEGTDALIATHGVDAAAEALDRLMRAAEGAADAQDVALLGSDVDSDGGKLILTAGAPKVTGDDEERVLLAARRILDAGLPIAVRLGVHRGSVFAGDIGPTYRRTYTVMGDAVNLAARLMAKAAPGTIYATADVLDRSNTLFETAELEPFAVKGKAEPVKAWSVGRATGSRTRQVTQQRLPLTGRNAELAVVRKALAGARSGTGQLVEIVGEAGIGKTRLLEAMYDAAMGYRKIRATCEAYTSAMPYAVWHELLREVLELGREETDDAVEQRLRDGRRRQGARPRAVAPAGGCGARPRARAHARGRGARRREPAREAARRRRALPDRGDAGPGDRRGRRRAPHGRGVGRSARVPAEAAAERQWLLGVARRPLTTGYVAAELPTCRASSCIRSRKATRCGSPSSRRRTGRCPRT
jgi:class 3 adenylate cyclase